MWIWIEDEEVLRLLQHGKTAAVSAPEKQAEEHRPAEKASRGPKGIDWSQQPLGQMTDAKLAKKLGVTPNTVFTRRRLLGIPPFGRQGRKPKKKTATVKPPPILSLDDQAEIRALARGGIGYEALADKYRVSEDAIAEVVLRRGVFA